MKKQTPFVPGVECRVELYAPEEADPMPAVTSWNFINFNNRISTILITIIMNICKIIIKIVIIMTT